MILRPRRERTYTAVALLVAAVFATGSVAIDRLSAGRDVRNDEQPSESSSRPRPQASETGRGAARTVGQPEDDEFDASESVVGPSEPDSTADGESVASAGVASPGERNGVADSSSGPASDRRGRPRKGLVGLPSGLRTAAPPTTLLERLISPLPAPAPSPSPKPKASTPPPTPPPAPSNPSPADSQTGDSPPSILEQQNAVEHESDRASVD